ncbi:MAG: MarR family transcriptional regulator [Nocardioidaceae bacterium]
MERLETVGGLRLDDQLCFALYAATRAITRRYRPLLDAIGLTYTQYLVMLTLWQDGPATVGLIAARLELDSHAVTPLVERLQVAGLVHCRRGTDRGRVVVAATELGRDLEPAAAAVQAEVAGATGLDPNELADLRRRLRTLSEQLTPEPRSSPHPAGGTTPSEGSAP